MKSINYLLCFQKEFWYNRISVILKLIFVGSSLKHAVLGSVRLSSLCRLLETIETFKGTVQGNCRRNQKGTEVLAFPKKGVQGIKEKKMKSPEHLAMLVNTYETFIKDFENS